MFAISGIAMRSVLRLVIGMLWVGLLGLSDGVRRPGERPILCHPGESLQRRHPGESRDPAPCSGSWLLVRFAKPASRPCALRRASLRAGHFLLLAQEKVTKEKGTPEGAVGDEAADCASALRRFADGTSLCRQRTRAPPARAPDGLFPPRTRRALGGPKIKSEAKPLCFVF